MRILIASWHRHIVGGAEAYLQVIIPALLRRGHEVALAHGYEVESGRETIDPAEDRLTRWCYQELGLRALFDRLEEWKPELVYTHGLESTLLESEESPK